MSSTNKTSHYELSQFIGTDKPAWLTDYNGDMLKIDTGLAAAAAEASGAQGTATSAASAAQAAQNTANQAVTSAQANAEDLTELKAALTNKVVNGTAINNQTTQVFVFSESDYIQCIKTNTTFAALPETTNIYGTHTRIPLYSIPGNVFKIVTSTITDDNVKIYCGVLNAKYTDAKGTSEIIPVSLRAFYDGANTIFFGDILTSQYSKMTRIANLWGNFTVLFSGNFVSVDV